MVKRSAASEYDLRRGRFAACTLKDRDRLLCVFQADIQDELLLVTRKGMAIRFSAEEVPETGRVSAGVRGMRLDENDAVISGSVFDNATQLIQMHRFRKGREYRKRAGGRDNGKRIPRDDGGSARRKTDSCYDGRVFRIHRFGPRKADRSGGAGRCG